MEFLARYEKYATCVFTVYRSPIIQYIFKASQQSDLTQQLYIISCPEGHRIVLKRWISKADANQKLAKTEMKLLR